ncbi:hypothetical protein O1L68_23795 [Streptomyces lydicus]|nr:hypothetical protein [Streptomyces lydicus]
MAGALRGGAGAVRYVGPAAEAVLAHFRRRWCTPGRRTRRAGCSRG